MAIINTKEKWCYLAHWRVASMSTEKALREQAGGVYVDNHHCARRTVEKQYDLDGYKVFCAVRHPLDWWVSWFYLMQYDKKLGTPMRVDDFVRQHGLYQWTQMWPIKTQIWLPTASDWWPWFQGPPRCFWPHDRDATHFVRFENLKNDIKRLIGHDLDLPVLGYSHGRKPWREYWSADNIEWALATLPDWRFGYDVDSP